MVPLTIGDNIFYNIGRVALSVSTLYEEELRLKIRKKYKSCLRKAAFAVMIAMAVFIWVFSEQGNAAGRKGAVSGCPGLSVFAGAGLENGALMAEGGGIIVLPFGYEVSVISETYSGDSKWYYISFIYTDNKSYTGYVRAQYIELGASGGSTMLTEAEFEQYLIGEGFPQSYHSYLKQLHKEHPLWVFEAQHTGLEWEASVNAESAVGKNLIPNSSPSSWKSMAAGAYNYATNTWVVFDGKTWVAASRDLIAYYMDPRNFLNSDSIFQFEVLSYNPAYQTADGINAILRGSFMEGSYVDTDGWAATYAEAFIYAAEKSGVSPFHLASRALQELGYSGSSSVSGTVSGYEGIFNFYNIGATSSSNPILNGLSFATQINEDYFMPWNTKWKAIAGGAVYLGKRYINVGQDTLYLQKFNVQGSNPYNHQYMTNVQAPNAEAGKLAKAYSGSAERAIVFKIPVYLNMPESNAQLPTGNGASNAYLASLDITGYVLTPTFNKDTFEYSLVLDKYVPQITVAAAAADTKASVSGGGSVKLTEGYNTVEVKVSTESGNSLTYTVKIAVPYDESTIIGDNYSLRTEGKVLQSYQNGQGGATYIYGFDAGITAAEAAAAMTPSNCSVRIVNTDRADNTGKIATGNIMQILTQDGTGVLREIPIVIFGDVNGDGEINGKDMLYMYRHLLGINVLSGIYAEAADVRWDNLTTDGAGAKKTDITGVDMLYIQRHILGISYISQR